MSAGSLQKLPITKSSFKTLVAKGKEPPLLIYPEASGTGYAKGHPSVYQGRLMS